MTQVGHTLTGMAVAVVFSPRKEPPLHRMVRLLIFGLLANLPDFPFPHWGHDLFYFSHSLFVNLLLILLFLSPFIFLPNLRSRVGGWLILSGGVLAWLSHLLLDTFYNHGLGLRMFWPFSTHSLALPIRWFSVVKDTSFPFTHETIRILLIEAAFYGSFLLIVIVLKKIGAFDWIAQN